MNVQIIKKKIICINLHNDHEIRDMGLSLRITLWVAMEVMQYHIAQTDSFLG